MKTSYAAIAACGILACSCAQKTPTSNYSLSVVVPQTVEQGTQAYLINYDTDAVLDSTIVEGDTLRMTGHVDQAIIARVKFPSVRRTFILEEGDIQIDADGKASGTTLNNDMEAWSTRVADLLSNENDSTKTLVNQLYSDAISKNNPLGYYALLMVGYDLNLAEFDSLLTQHPYYADFKRIERLRDAKIQAAKTAPGQPYLDFEITDSTSTIKLSDLVRPGQYTLVDFWASWCRYCIMEIPTMKSLAEKYGDKGLNIVGVAVWDEREASEQSIIKHDVTWPQILNAQNVPTDTYGVTGIPQIFLIGPDGKIVARDLHGERLTTVVDSVMAGFSPTE